MKTERERLLALLRRYGWNATSFQALEPEFRYWFADDDAAVAYFDTGGAWVVAGPPVAPEERLGDVAARFAAHARSHRKRVAFFAVERRFLSAIAMRAIAIGQQPRWDPRAWAERHRGHRSLKEQLRRSRAKGVSIERLDSSSIATASVREPLDRLISRWLSFRVMPPMTFLVELNPFLFPEERRYYVARAGPEIKGLLVAVPVYQRNGWFFENILRDPEAPNGTVEALINAAMIDAAAGGSTFVTLGLAPLAGEDRWLRVVRAAMQGFYNFEGLHAFKAKLRPDAWDPIFLAWPEERTAAGAIYDALDAFAGGALMRFGLRSIFRAPSSVLFILGVLLIPWTGAIALAESDRWFPSRTVQLGWAAFDVLMTGVIVSLAKRWRRDLAVTACALAAADGVLTAVQVMRYNARRVRRVRDAAIVAAAVAAPFLAAAILFGGLRTRKEGRNERHRRPRP